MSAHPAPQESPASPSVTKIPGPAGRTVSSELPAPIDDGERGQFVLGGILKERTKRRQAGVASTGAVAPLLLQVLEEAQDQLRIKVG